jgi:CheY-like chemotaxis protein
MLAYAAFAHARAYLDLADRGRALPIDALPIDESSCDTRRRVASSKRPPRTTDSPPELEGAIVSSHSRAAAEAKPAEPSSKPTFAPVAVGASGAPSVLVVEDDESIRSLVIRALATRYTVYEATDGQQAADFLDAMPPPACIVSDVMMPRMDGLTLVKKIKTTPSLRSTPVIFLTAKNHALDVVQGINAGARHYLSKPFKMKELLDKVAAILPDKK